MSTVCRFVANHLSTVNNDIIVTYARGQSKHANMILAKRAEWCAVHYVLDDTALAYII